MRNRQEWFNENIIARIDAILKHMNNNSNNS